MRLQGQAKIAGLWFVSLRPGSTGQACLGDPAERSLAATSRFMLHLQTLQMSRSVAGKLLQALLVTQHSLMPTSAVCAEI